MFRTELTPHPIDPQISVSDRIVTLGSCFSEMLGKKLLADKFDVLSNPLGILYNPVSQHRLLGYALGLQDLHDHLVSHDGIFYHFDAHSRVNAPDGEQLTARMKEGISRLNNYLESSKWLILTYGTANVYSREGRVVANCHKQPAAVFTRRLLTVKEMISDIEPVLAELRRINPTLNILLTVSPIRHIRDTLEINSVSKSLLRVFCHEICLQYPNVRYFPSFELMIDDLRDYRFYTRDMIHPSEVAEDYIYEKFCRACFTSGTLEILSEWRKVRQALGHRPFHPELPAYRSFLKSTMEKLRKFSGKLDVEPEIRELNERLKDANY